MRANRKLLLLLLFFGIFPLLVGLACTCGLLPFGKDSGSSVEEVVEVVVTEEIVVEEPTLEVTDVEEIIVEEPTVEEPQEIIIAPGEELIATDLTWLQEEREVFVGLFLKNQYPDMNLESIDCYINLLDADGGEIRRQRESIRWLFPGHTVGIGYRTILPEDAPPVDSVTIEYEYKSANPTAGYENPFTVDNIKIWTEGTRPVLTGTVHNHTTTIFTDVRLNFHCYDAQGEIIGGGYNYLWFIPGESEMGFNIVADVYGEVDSVEVFPILTAFTVTMDDTPEFWEPVSIIEHAYQENKNRGLNGGFVLQNNLEDTILKGTLVQVTFFDQDGFVTTYGTQNIPYLLPGATLGLHPAIFSQPQGAASVDYQIDYLPGVFVDNYEIMEDVFRVNSTEITGSTNEYVLVNFTNTYSKPVSEVDIYILLYDADGTIIGGAKSNYKESMPPGSTAEKEVYVYYHRDNTIADIEVWILPNTFTKYE